MVLVQDAHIALITMNCVHFFLELAFFTEGVAKLTPHTKWFRPNYDATALNRPSFSGSHLDRLVISITPRLILITLTIVLVFLVLGRVFYFLLTFKIFFLGHLLMKNLYLPHLRFQVSVNNLLRDSWVLKNSDKETYHICNYKHPTKSLHPVANTLEYRQKEQEVKTSSKSKCEEPNGEWPGRTDRCHGTSPIRVPIEEETYDISYFQHLGRIRNEFRLLHLFRFLRLFII